MDGKVETVRKTISAGYRDCMRMVRDGRYKLIYYPHIGKRQLYDLEVDPEETNDLLTSWRRDAEGRACPPSLSPQCREYEPDPAAGSGYNPDNNPLYQPALPRKEVDRIVELLSANLMDWQAEVGDPLL